MKNLIITILAGGSGKRMNSELPKVLHLVNGIPMIVKLITEIINLNPYKIIIVVGKTKNIIISTIEKYFNVNNLNIIFAEQLIPLGTGNAVLSTLDILEDNFINLIVNGDNPMLTVETINSAIKNFIINNSQLQITSIYANNPTGNGRIILYENEFHKIIEEKDCTDEQKKINLVNCGIYVANTNILKKYIPQINNNNAQNEYYLTDIVEICKNTNAIKITLFIIDKNKELEIININTREQLDHLNNTLSIKN
jgi:bifunctional N-acetylglucosamine-1-phosphate-uridyltransferase/glucosamine-1-phosphate-acetyltransferase GlmU-like protein